MEAWVNYAVVERAGREDLSLEWTAGDTPIVLGISARLWKDYLLYEVT